MPSLTSLSAAQLTFLTLHVKRSVDKWQWLFGDSTLRAWAGKRSAALARSELAELVEAGLLQEGRLGVSLLVTAEGRELVTRRETVVPRDLEKADALAGK